MPGRFAASLKDLVPGDHACAIDDAGEERAKALSLFVALGLERQEFCSLGVWPGTARRVLGLLRDRGVDGRGAIRRGDLRLVKPDAFYFDGGRFDARRIIEGIGVAIRQALARGYRSARFAGECERAVQVAGREFVAYERAMGRVFEDYPVVGLCCYDPSSVSPELLGGIVNVHPLLTTGADLCRNPFYTADGSGQPGMGELYMRATRAVSLVSSLARTANAACRAATEVVSRSKLAGQEFVLQRFLRAMCDLTGGVWGSVHLCDPRDGALRLAALVGGDGGTVLRARPRGLDSFLEGVFQRGKGEILDNVRNETAFPPGAPRNEARSVVAVPIEVSGLTAGVVSVGSNTAGSFTERDLEAVGAMARVLAAFVPDWLWTGEEAPGSEFSRLLAEVSDVLSSASPVERMFGLACKECLGRLAVDSAAVWQLVDGSKTLWCSAAEGVGASLWKGCVVEAGDADSLVAAAVRTGTVQVADGGTIAQRLGQVAPLVAGCGSVMAMPVSARGMGKGCLTLSRLSPGATFSADDVERGWQFAAVVSTAMGVAMAHAQRGLAERMEALGHLADGISSRASDPLTEILGFAQLLKMDEKDIVRAGYLERVEREAKNLAATLGRLHEFSFMGQTPSGAPFEVNAVVAEAVAKAQARWEEERAAGRPGIVAQVEYGPAGWAAGDISAMRAALVDIIDNARDGMGGVGELGVATWAEGGFACVSVADTGSGLGEEIRRKAFDPFFTTKGEGRPGLGLSTAYSVVRRHGGDITVRTIPQKGTVFTVRVPRADGPKCR